MDDLIRRSDAIRLAEQGQIQGFPWQFEQLVKLPSEQLYTESEIQSMQNLEQAQLDKAYELGWKEGREALGKEIREDGRDQINRRTTSDLISKRNAIYLSKRYHPTTVVDEMAYDKELGALQSEQTECEKGHWILPRETLCEEDNIQCSICGFMSHPMIVRWNQGIGYRTVGKLELPYTCPKCHTDMREENTNGRSS